MAKEQEDCEGKPRKLNLLHSGTGLGHAFSLLPVGIIPVTTQRKEGGGEVSLG